MVGIIREQNAIKLAEIVRREVDLYAAISDDALFYPVLDDQNLTYTVIIVENKRTDESVWVVVMAHVVDDFVVIEEDRTDKPLRDALMVNGGVPREQIILAYKGETIPDSTGQ